MTTESTEIEITTAHAETTIRIETTTTYEMMMMTTEIEPEQLSTPSATFYSKLDISSALQILTPSTPNTVLDATTNISPSMPNHASNCNLSTMPSAPIADAPLPSLSIVKTASSKYPNYGCQTDISVESMPAYFSWKKAATTANKHLRF